MSKSGGSSENNLSQKDGKYFERRKRNNVAAKKSRDARKQREDEIAIRASFLEKENSILKAQLQTLKDEAQQLRILLSQKKTSTVGHSINSGCSNCSGMACQTSKPQQQANANLNGLMNNVGYGMQSVNGSGVNIGLLSTPNQQLNNVFDDNYLHPSNQHRHQII
jgi:hypothetical protein